jgi:hypothetical protein
LNRLTLAAACAALATLSVSSAAFASDPVTAKLASPVAQPVKFIAGGAVFECADDVCLAKAATSETFSTATCKQIAAKVGPVAAYTAFRAFDDQRLAACNASAVAKSATGAQLAKQ